MISKILITGINGFLGRNNRCVLQEYGYDVIGLDLNHSDLLCDIAREIPVLPANIDVVLHAAGKAHSIPTTKVEESVFFDVNYQGTVNLCKAFENAGYMPKSFVFISTVAVYGCDSGENITENQALNGNSPYALSKIQAEQYLSAWCEKQGVVLSILRPSLIAGPHPPGNLGAMIEGIKNNNYFNIAGGRAKKSVLMVQDIAHLIPLLMKKGGVFNVCSDECPTFKQLALLISQQSGKKEALNIPLWVAYWMALIGNLLGKKAPINIQKLKKMTDSLTFSNEKAKKELNWHPISVLNNFKID